MDHDWDWPHMLQWAIEGSGVRAVYQPIVDLHRHTVAGYEALARFVGYPVRHPEPWLLAAHLHDCDAELQAAALQAALQDRDRVPADRFLTVNLAPDVLDTAPVRRVWTGQGNLRGVVIELTHPTDDRAVVTAVHRAGALLAVDHDSGLAPHADIVKVAAGHRPDRPLRADARIIAQGIESAAELAALADLNVALAQGYHLGRPARHFTAT